MLDWRASMNTSLKNTFNALSALLAGGFLVLAFAPFSFYPLAFIAPAVLLSVCLNTQPKQATLYGFLFGLGLFSAGIYWIYISIHTFGQAPAVLSFFITLLFVLILALFLMAQSYALARIPACLSWRCLALFPTLWVINEALRSWVLTGFPWLFLGYTQLNTPLRNYAPIIGVYGLSFLVALLSGALVLLFKAERKQKYRALLCITLVILGGLGLAKFKFTQAEAKRISVSLIQGNIPQSLKWDPTQAEKTLKLYAELTGEQPPGDLIIWPEGAIPIFDTHAHVYLNSLDKRLKAQDQTLIAGIPIDEWPKLYNGLLMLGRSSGRYLKVHLVPFGEYYPAKWLLSPLFDYLHIPLSDLSPGPSEQDILRDGELRIAPFICYEIAYPQQVLHQLKDAQVIVSLSDDSWYGNSIAAAQHLEMAQLRALETQRYLLFSTNSGISAVINPKGQLIAHLGLNVTGVIHAQIHAIQGSTPLMLWGYKPLAVLIFVLALLMFRARPRA